MLERLLRDPECLGAIAAFRLASLDRLAPGLARWLVRRALTRQLRGVSDVHSMQMVIKGYMDRMISGTSGGLTVSGLERLDPGRAWLFISNHRDIAMDPAFTNFALHAGGHQTVRIAIGDNLLTKPWVSDLMRLNKSFIVRRSVSGPRELLAVSRQLSAYIRHSLQQDNAPVWIAQREGRAKDGVDRTEPAVIKMLAMSRDKRSESFGEHIAGLGIVPVAISYELDPCDALKAKELAQLARDGQYLKGEQEDVASIGQGITGYKGRVHVSFGTPIGAGCGDAGAVAAEVDRQILAGYCLHPTNLYAWHMLHPGEQGRGQELKALYSEDGDCSREQFEARIGALPADRREYALAIYANAVTAKLGMPC